MAFDYGYKINLYGQLSSAFRFYRYGKIKRWAKLTGQSMPEIEHLECFEVACVATRKIGAEYLDKLNQASLHTFGKPWHLSMYKVSGIGRDEFSEEHKSQLRELTNEYQKQKDLAGIHLAFLPRKGKAKLQKIFYEL